MMRYCFRVIDLLRRETAWLKNGLFSLLFVYFFVRSAATHSKISLNQEKNPLFLISSTPVATSLLLKNKHYTMVTKIIPKLTLYFVYKTIHDEYSFDCWRHWINWHAA